MKCKIGKLSCEFQDEQIQDVTNVKSSAGFVLDRWIDRLGDLVVKASASGAEDPGFNSRLLWDFSGSSHTSDLNIGTPVATLPGVWRYRLSTGTSRPGVSIL